MRPYEESCPTCFDRGLVDAIVHDPYGGQPWGGYNIRPRQRPTCKGNGGRPEREEH